MIYFVFLVVLSKMILNVFGYFVVDVFLGVKVMVMNCEV